MKKILSLLLAGVMLFSMIPAAYATNSYDNPSDETEMGTTVEYDANDRDGDGQLDNLMYTVTVPAKMNPGGNGSVSLEGNWPSNATIEITADKSVDMVNSRNKNDIIALPVTFAGINAPGSDTQFQTYFESISVANMFGAFFGTWEGVFYYNVEYIESPESTEQISFTIRHYETYEPITYYAVNGMTWGEWIESEYNTAGFSVQSYGVGVPGYCLHATDGAGYAQVEDIIVAGHEYRHEA